ncbi:hypothetical protein EPK99_24620 [Neorhizobium lilium]|uniref:BrnT family toxin n=1 Tax=Neorhizobium lilium TaxID=2503024 RepID=A0A444L9Y8_9HYPH|nr:BrnT family toxin [Neorhizobium lilium]RWX74374.1 hypothetical protein EPK99_24620 [Neorhizobium lilium]
MKITWDEPKREANLAKHGMDFADLSLEFFAASAVIPAKAGRSMAIGLFEGRVIIAVVFHSLGSEALSVISMRLASGKERKIHDD